MSVEIQDRNGVRVRVRRSENGSTVEADCRCFGNPRRTHSNPFCPLVVDFASVETRIGAALDACSCHGAHGRSHSNEACPLRAVQENPW